MKIESWKLMGDDGSGPYPLSRAGHADALNPLLKLHASHSFSISDIHSDVHGLWRYAAMLPLHSFENRVSFCEGFTPLIQESFGGTNLIFKLEYLFPSGSFKDRGATVAISQMKEQGVDCFVEDSSGNAGAALATYAAKAGMQCEIYISDRTTISKIKQLTWLGAKVVQVSGTREDVANTAQLRAKEIYYASHVFNPLFLAGTKTFAYEVWEQSKGSLPKEILFPVGNGTLLLGAWIGFEELRKAGLISFIPRLSAVQAQNCSPLLNGQYPYAATMAEGIAIQKPARKSQILEIIEQTAGSIISVSESDINEAWSWLSSKGHFVEKTSAVPLAGWIKIKKPENTLIPLTGHGLKSI